MSGIETSEVSSIQSTSARNKKETYTIATVTTKWNPEIESSSAVSNSLIKSTSTSYERDTDSVTDSTTLPVVPDSLLENIPCGKAFMIFTYDWYRHARIWGKGGWGES